MIWHNEKAKCIRENNEVDKCILSRCLNQVQLIPPSHDDLVGSKYSAIFLSLSYSTRQYENKAEGAEEQLKLLSPTNHSALNRA